MHISKFENCLTVNQAIRKIETNDSQSFEWYPVDNGLCKFELGGRKGELKAYVPNMKNGKMVYHQNCFTDSRYALIFHQDNEKEGEYCYELPTANGRLKKIKKAAFINLLKTDLTKIKVVTRGWTERIVHSYACTVS